MLRVHQLSVEIGGQTVLRDASFSIAAGEKVGLVGRNGAGKTSLLRVLAGELDSTAGTIWRSQAVGYLGQDPRLAGIEPGTTAVAHILSGRGVDDAVVRIEKLRLAMEEDPSERNVGRYGRAEERFRADGGYAADSEARRIAAGLGLPADRLDLPLTVLSGGERRRVELSRILFGGSDLLLLDEPTNHLDTDAKSWLMQFLRGHRGALLVVSHDLELLDDAIDRVLHLDRRGEEQVGDLIGYRGTYSQYRAARATDQERRAKLATAQEKEMGRLKAVADSMRGSSATRARKAKVLDHRVERMRAEAIEGPGRDRVVSMPLPDPPHCGKVTLEVEHLAASYDGPPVFEGVDFYLARGERLLVMGLNGAGKTTLLRILAGQRNAEMGTVEFGHQVSAGYYAQEHDGLVAELTPFDHLGGVKGVTDVGRRSILGAFGLSGDKVFQAAGTLSGGEKTKLALAQLVVGRHNLLLLDEPTNNLDPPSRQSAADTLRRWKGAMVLVSHDTEFVRLLAPERVLFMPDGELDYWDDEYLDLVSLA